jgi:hypothetical protein
MSAVAGPYGLRVIKHLGDLPFGGGMHTLPLTTNQAKGFFFGDPVGLVAGVPTPLVASPTTAIGPNSPIGVFMGCEYQDPVRGFVNAQFLPANVITGGATKVRLKIADSPDLVFAVQANGPVTIDKIGSNAALVGPFAAGSLATGNSLVALDIASIAAPAATLAVRIYDFVYHAGPSPGASSIPGDAFTDVLVIWNAGVHRYSNSSGQ